MSITTEIASTLLGKKVDGSATYDPSLLVAVPRYENRKQYDIKNEDLPFVGFDVWQAYEFSAMTEAGLPVTRVAKIKYNCNNEHIVESKSIKLYLNSYNMERYGKTTEECLAICKNQIESDLTKLLNTPVQLNFLDNDCEFVHIYEQFENLMKFVDEKAYYTYTFNETPELLEVKEETPEYRDYYFRFDALRSNCRVTHQPDWGDLFIYYRSNKHISEESLVKYFTSFRKENHFHEEITECCYKRLYDLLGISEDKNSKLFVNALYTRRGGIDINPVRASEESLLSLASDLGDLNKYARGTTKQ